MPSDDDIYEQAKIFAATSKNLCIANLQRNLIIGYNRAAKLMESMVQDRFVEKYDTEYGGVGYRLNKKN